MKVSGMLTVCKHNVCANRKLQFRMINHVAKNSGTKNNVISSHGIVKASRCVYGTLSKDLALNIKCTKRFILFI